MSVQIRKSLTDDRRENVMNAERLGDIGSGVLHDHWSLFFALHRRDAGGARCGEFTEKCCRSKPDVYISRAGNLRLLDIGRTGESIDKHLRDIARFLLQFRRELQG